MPDQGTSPEIPERQADPAEPPNARHSGELPGAEGGDGSDAADTPPGLPADHDAELGSTDQHSNA